MPTTLPPVLEDPLASRLLRGLLTGGDDVPTDHLCRRLGTEGGGASMVAAAVLLRRLAEAGLVSYRPGPPGDAGLPCTLHSLTAKGRQEARHMGEDA